MTNEKEVADIFYDFFVNVAKDIGQNYTFDRGNHPSINKILDQNFGNDVFNFRPTDQKTVSKIIRKFNVKKASGFDEISIKLLKLGQQSLVPLLTNLVNHTIMSSIVPERLKFGQVTPIFKKNDPIDKANHRPVTLHPVHSKIYEKVLAEQLSEHFGGIFDKYLCAFRKGHGCQTTLLRLIEDWKEAMEKNHYVAAVLMTYPRPLTACHMIYCYVSCLHMV